jgi:hypothetical protein
VTALADVLEAIHNSRRRLRTVRAAGLFNDRGWRMWWAGPKHVRTEEERDDGVQIIVQAGDQWWIREPSGKGHTNEGDPNVGVGFGPGLDLLHSRPLLGSTVLEYLHEEEIAGRRAAVLRARPHPRRGGVEWWGSRRPFRVAIDLERGILLRARRIEVTEVAFDEDLETSVFTSPLLADQPLESTARRSREVPCEEAGAVVGFPVRLPRFLPEGARLIRCLVSPNDPPGWIGHSWTIDPGGRYRLSIRQGPDLAERAGQHGGGIVTREGVAFQVEEYRGSGFRTENVAFELDGTWFEISSDLPLETILDIAMSIGEAT